MRGAILAVLWLGCAAAWADPPITGPAEIKRDAVGVLKVDAGKGGRFARLKIPPGLDVAKSEDGKRWYVAGKPGAYTITGELWVKAYDADGRLVDFDIQDVDYSLRVTGDPDPPPPVPPGPDPPGPNPPGPAPIPADGLHVLVVIDPMANNLTREQVDAISGQEWYDYLKAKAPKDKTGQSAWRIYKAGQQVLDTEDPVWKAAFARAAGKTLPWVIVSNPNGGGGVEQELPKTKAEILALLKKFGG